MGDDSYDMETKRRGPIYAEYRGPGPLAYKLRPLVGTNDHCTTKKIGPAYSIGLKRKDPGNQNPGPAYCYDASMTSKGKQEPPKYSLSSRPKSKNPEITPGPGSYNPQNTKPGTLSVEKKTPSVVIGQRTNWPFKNEAPPPNSYDKPTTVGSGSGSVRRAPSWSFSARSDVGGFSYELIRKGNPGPGSYGATEPGVFKKKSGCYSMQPRTRVKEYNSALQNPGPGSYDPKQPKYKRDGFTMGTRHSDYVLPLITDPDVM